MAKFSINIYYKNLIYAKNGFFTNFMLNLV